MSVKMKRIIALSVCGVLLAVAVVQNVRSNKGEAGELKVNKPVNVDSVSKDDESEEFFANARLERESERAAAAEECSAVISDAESTEEERRVANEKSDNLEAMTQAETKLESVIAGRGYENVLVLMKDSGDMEITVSGEIKDEAEASAIAQLAQESTGVSIDNLCLKCFNK